MKRKLLWMSLLLLILAGCSSDDDELMALFAWVVVSSMMDIYTSR